MISPGDWVRWRDESTNRDPKRLYVDAMVVERTGDRLKVLLSDGITHDYKNVDEIMRLSGSPQNLIKSTKAQPATDKFDKLLQERMTDTQRILQLEAADATNKQRIDELSEECDGLYIQVEQLQQALREAGAA